VTEIAPWLTPIAYQLTFKIAKARESQPEGIPLDTNGVDSNDSDWKDIDPEALYLFLS
jgi:hypothetical protein